MRPGSLRIRISDLTLVPELSPRERISEEAVLRYMDSFAALPPIRVQRGTRVVIDGFHRVEAATRLGLEEIEACEEPVSDDDIRLVAALANMQHGEPLTRPERNRMAVLLVQHYGRLREEAAELLGMAAPAVTMALREHQLNQELSERMGEPVQVINSAHVRALYRVGPEQREQLLEVIVSKVDAAGRPRPLSGAELKLLVDRLLDPSTPAAEMRRLMEDPQARPRPAAADRPPSDEIGSSSPSTGPSAPWNDDAEEWESPLRSGDSESGGLRPLDAEVHGRLERAARALAESGGWGESPFLVDGTAPPARPREEWSPELSGLHDAVSAAEEIRRTVGAAARALGDLLPRIEQQQVRDQAGAVHALLLSIASGEVGA